MQSSYNDLAVATANLRGMDIAELIDFAIAKKSKADFAKAELEVINAEIQDRAINFQEDRHIKFTEWHGSEKALATVTVASTMDILNIVKLKDVLGKELVDEKIRVKQDIKYDIDASFKRALIALILDDYDDKMSIDEVIDATEWCVGNPEKKATIKKKLKGDYKKDKKVILDALNLSDEQIDIDTELFIIYQIKNFELIKAYFDIDSLDEVKELVKRYVTVDETAKIGLKAI
jgi:hypothetical protein